MDLNSQLPRRRCRSRGTWPSGGDPQVGPTFVDDPLAAGANPSPPDRIVSMGSNRLRRAGDGQRPGSTYEDFLANDIGGTANRLTGIGHIENGFAVWRPHRRRVLSGMSRETAVIVAVGV